MKDKSYPASAAKMMARFMRTTIKLDNDIGRVAMKIKASSSCLESRRRTIERIFLTILLMNVRIINVAASHHRIARAGEPSQNANQPSKNLNAGSYGAGGGIAVAVGLAETEPEFTTPIRNITTPVGKEAVLSCTVDRIAKYKVGWLKAEDQTILTLHDKVVTHNVRVTVTHDSRSTWRLHIRQVKESDRGCYMCQINTNVMKKQIGCIDVHVPPDILYGETSTDVSVREGDNASLVCRATGHPAPKITWRREDSDHILLRKNSRDVVKEESYNGSTLFFWKVDRKQMGAYLCVASNDVPPAVSKRIILSVNFSPTIRVPNQLLGAPLNTDVQLECIVEAYPNTVNYWDKNGEIIFDGSKYSVKEWRENYTVRMRLLVRHFNKTDIGTYKCVSTNSVGRAEGVLRLYDFAETSAKRKYEGSDADKASKSSRNRGHTDAMSSKILLLTYIAVYGLYGQTNAVIAAR